MKCHFSLPCKSSTATAEAILGSWGLTSEIDPVANKKQQSFATCCHLIVFSIIILTLKDTSIALWSPWDNSQLVTVAAILVADTQGCRFTAVQWYYCILIWTLRLAIEKQQNNNISYCQTRDSAAKKYLLLIFHIYYWAVSEEQVEKESKGKAICKLALPEWYLLIWGTIFFIISFYGFTIILKVIFTIITNAYELLPNARWDWNSERI